MPRQEKADLIEGMLARERYEREHGSTATEMPKYRCHKEVWALKIADVIDPTRPNDETDGSRLIVPADVGYATFRVDRAYVNKHDPKPGGYYVVYADGYKSFSPPDAFEGGYTRV